MILPCLILFFVSFPSNLLATKWCIVEVLSRTLKPYCSEVHFFEKYHLEKWNEIFWNIRRSVPFHYLYDIFIKNARGPSTKQRKNGIPLRPYAFMSKKKKKAKGKKIHFYNEKKILLDLLAYANSLREL